MNIKQTFNKQISTEYASLTYYAFPLETSGNFVCVDK